ncbi:MAG: PHP domain-containing protein [Promethearchaeota archaeon]
MIEIKIYPDKNVHGLRYDLHIHTQFSNDSLVNIRNIDKILKKKKLDGIAITDHTNLKGYRYLKRTIKDKLIIPGMEVNTNIGELIGLFIIEELDLRKKHFLDVIDDIKDKDGVVIIPHPFDELRSNHLKIELIQPNILRKSIDGVEILNSRIIFKRYIIQAQKLQMMYDFAETGGSDAHTNGEIGNGYTFIPVNPDVEYLSLEELKKQIIKRNSKSCGKQSNPLVHAITVATKFKNNLFYKNI